MQQERKTFYNDFQKSKEELNPVEEYAKGGTFPWRMLACIFVILLTSFQVYFMTTHTADHSRQFVRALNYYILDHTGFDFYWAGSFNFNYPIQQYFTLETFNDMMVTMWSYMGSFSDSVYGEVDQELLNSTAMNLTVIYENGSVVGYPWTIGEGIITPFSIDNIPSMKAAFNGMAYMEIAMLHIPMGDKDWSIRMLIENYSQASLIVTLICDETLSLWQEHLPGMLAAIILAVVLIVNRFKSGIPFLEMVLALILLISSVLSFDTEITMTTQLILDGLACLFSWLWLLQIIPQKGIYHVSMLLGKSYLLVGRLFISFMPLFVGFALLAYCVFCRYAHQFSSFKQTLLSLFYVCYYNMTYEEFIVTSRADPISSIFFFVFVLLFTFCVYSSMLVSVFCSFAWDRRQQEMQKDILDNLKIKCSNCQFIYRYDEKLLLKEGSQTSFIASGPMDEQRLAKTKRLLEMRIENARRKVDVIVGESIMLQQELSTRTKINTFQRMLTSMLKEKYNIVLRNLSKARD